jgi:hypothetical protein
VLYVASAFETALLETIYHHARSMARTSEAPGWTSQFRELALDLDAWLHDLRGGQPAFAPTLDRESYRESQALAAALRTRASEGLVYPSQRHQCAGLFYPDRVTNVIQGRRLDYHWNGTLVDFYRDAGSGDVYRVSYAAL